MTVANNDRIRIALQNKGRLTTESGELLRHAGLEFEAHDRRLMAPCRNFELDILFVRDDDIPEYVQDGVVDLGIVGFNTVLEQGAEVEQLRRLGFGYCSLVIAVPNRSPVTDVRELAGSRIATAYPNSLRTYLAERDLEAEIIEIHGGAEVAPALNVGDAICDLTSTGSTLRINDLRPLETIYESESVLIANPASLNGGVRGERIERLLLRVDSYLTARGLRYVMLNAPTEALEEIRQILPGLRSPTVIPLADPELVAVHAAVEVKVFWEVLERLKAAGGSDILVVPVEQMMA